MAPHWMPFLRMGTKKDKMSTEQQKIKILCDGSKTGKAEELFLPSSFSFFNQVPYILGGVFVVPNLASTRSL